ncbi:fatty acyl-CoA reductase wat-like [Armigeres subalbatus]|uniref:fatty acyl-CoA reductase wat-like n=1 Tax=Armigeres subalbatus TaxID=124917 RepID=UPI002ED5C0BE
MSDGDHSKVGKFYRGSTVFITGATGFLGQVLLEKILRSLDVAKVYVMIRAKRNSTGAERLHRILEGALFDKVRQDPPGSKELRSKVIPVEVDLSSDGDLVEGDIKSRLLEEVDVVFNLLASISFNEPLDCAMRTNVVYSDRLLEFVSQMKRLKVVVHVSTFYSNCDKNMIEERIYDDIGFGGYANIINIVSNMSDSEVRSMEPHVIKRFPNTYTFSKKCAEVMVREKYGSLPIGIFRPPIVTSTYQEPITGWINNFNGPSGLVVMLSEGLYSAAFLDTRKRPFIVPVDYCVNALLMCAIDIVEQRSLAPIIPVYNYTNPDRIFTWDKICARFCEGLPPGKRVLAYCLTATITRNPVRYAICKTIMRIEGLFLDFIRQLRGQKPAMSQIFERMISQSDVLKFFTFREWTMRNDNIQRLWRQEVSREDAETFPFDLTQVDWDAYYRSFIPGVVKYAIQPRKEKEQKSNVDKGKWEGKQCTLYAIWSILFFSLLKLVKYFIGR